MAAVFPLCLQVALLYLIIRLSRPQGDAGLFHTFFNPGSFFVLFAGLFFVVPQLYGIFNDFYLDSYPTLLAPRPLSSIFISAQWQLCAFFLFVALGVFAVHPLARRSANRNAADLVLSPPTSRQWNVLAGFLIFGIAANVVLSIDLQGGEAFRSSLVKTPEGQVLTTVVYFGEFAAALILAHSVVAKRYLLGLLSFGAFAASVFLTGSRGRILWPAAIALVLLIARNRKMRFGRLAIAGIAAILILLLIDPFTKYLNTGQPVDFTAILNVDSIFQRRNFDGMSNFTLITQSGVISPDGSRWISGANDDFMNIFFPEVLAQGVAFGVTVPGWFYMAGGPLGLCLGGIFYGIGLEMLNGKIRSLRSPELLVGYLFAITWLAAIGGNLVGSLDKAAANFAPALVYLFLCRTSNSAGWRSDSAKSALRPNQSKATGLVSREPSRSASLDNA